MSEWQDRPSSLELTPGELHVFRFELDVDEDVLHRLEPLLAEDECARAARFLRPRIRRRFTAGRGSLRLLLSEYLHRPPKSIAFDLGPQGKPALAERDNPLQFNLSHSGGLALLAITSAAPVGVDLEHVRRKIDHDKIARRFFSPAEARNLLALPESSRAEQFFVIWTRKEAVIKARGGGLSIPLDSFEVPVRPGEPAALLRTTWDAEETKRWRLHDLYPGPDFVAALAVGADVDRLRCLSWAARSVL